MTETISASFSTRRDADMAVEHLVQEYGLPADAIMVAPAAEANSSGVAPSGGDLEGGPEKPRLAGRLVVSAKVDKALTEKVHASFASYGGERWAI